MFIGKTIENKLATPSTPAYCYHCGEDCKEDAIQLSEKHFCCEGCKMVYVILNENDLCRYYEIEEKAGISLKGKRKEQYAYLDANEVREKLIDFTDGQRTKVTFLLPQIHCSSCIWLLENLYRLNDNILSSKVNFLKKELYINFDESDFSLKKLVEMLASIGYAPAINLNDLEDKPRMTTDKRLYYQLGVAGFAFGNIMLLSFPEYLGLGEWTDASIAWFFGYLNILLSILVVFYSAGDYLRSAWLGLQQYRLNIDVPITLGIFSIFGRSFFEIVTHTGAGFLDSLSGLVFFLLIGKWFQQRTWQHLSFERDYKSYFPIAATLLKNNQQESISLHLLQRGDTILIRHQELIPADGVLLEGEAKIDYSFVTGEAEPIPLSKGEQLFAGGRQMGKSIKVGVTKKVTQSYLTQLWNEEAFTKKVVNPTTRLADKVGKYFTFIILLIAFSTLFYWLPKDIHLAINAFTAVLIIACPCAIALSIPFTFGNITRVLARQSFFLKNTSVVESLQKITAIVLDKTGTLTNGFKNEIHYLGNQQLRFLERQLIHALTRHSNHPISKQLQTQVGVVGDSLQVHRFKEYPGKGIEGYIGYHFIRIGSKKWLNVPDSVSFKDATVFIEIDGQCACGFLIKNHYRKGLKKVLKEWQKNHKVFLLSGDNERERPYLESLFQNPRQLHFQQSPKDKLEFIQNLQLKGEKVLMLGDGLNDAGALKQSDVGIVLTENTNNFTPACDAILDAKQFAYLPNFMRYAQRGVQIVYWSYLLAAIYNIIGLSFAMQGTLSPVIAAILMPLSSVSIVLFGVGMSTLLSIKQA